MRIAPRRRVCMPGSTACAHRNAPLACVCIIASQSSSVTASIGARRLIAASLNSGLTEPTVRATDPSLRQRSCGVRHQRRPREHGHLADGCHRPRLPRRCELRSATTIRMRAASRLAVARPMPLPAPVIRIVSVGASACSEQPCSTVHAQVLRGHEARIVAQQDPPPQPCHGHGRCGRAGSSRPG